MQITTTNKAIQIRYGKDIFMYPFNSVSYAVNERMDSITFFGNNNLVGTSPIGDVSVDGESLTADNVDEVLGKLYK